MPFWLPEEAEHGEVAGRTRFWLLTANIGYVSSKTVFLKAKYWQEIIFKIPLGPVCVLNRVRLLEAPRTGAHQAPLSIGFPQERILEWVATSFSSRSA